MLLPPRRRLKRTNLADILTSRGALASRPSEVGPRRHPKWRDHAHAPLDGRSLLSRTKGAVVVVSSMVGIETSGSAARRPHRRLHEQDPLALKRRRGLESVFFFKNYERTIATNLMGFAPTKYVRSTIYIVLEASFYSHKFAGVAPLTKKNPSISTFSYLLLRVAAVFATPLRPL